MSAAASRQTAAPPPASARAAAKTGSLGAALRVWSALGLLALVALALALASGSTPLGWAELPALLLKPDDSVAAEVLHSLRLPRALAAMATGGLLAVAGALMQVLLRNPLADPYVLGLSGGAASGALAALWLGAGAWLVHAGAFGGALLTVVMVFGFARRELSSLSAAGTQDHAPRLLLTGVMLAAGWTAVVTLMLALAPEARLRGMLFWLAGDLSGADAGGWPLLALGAVLLACAPLARELNVLLQGPATARALGVNVARLRLMLFALASAAAAVAVTTSGSIGFIGLVVPHALRLLIGNDQRLLLPACALGGGALLVLADTLARTIVAPQQLPVGVITASLGVPTFLVLLRRGARRP